MTLATPMDDATSKPANDFFLFFGVTSVKYCYDANVVSLWYVD